MATAFSKAGKNWRKTPDSPALPSVIARTLGKAGLFAECQATALGKGEGFAECHRKHSAKGLLKKNKKILCREPTLGKQFREKNYINSLPSVVLETLGKATVMIARR